MTLILQGTIRIPADRVVEFRPHLLAMMAASRAEPECIAYSLAESAADPGVIHIFEHFTGPEALAFHRASPHMAAWRERLAEVGMTDRDMKSYDVTDYRQIP